jgi:CBS domain containing-hemolysin-like protein
MSTEMDDSPADGTVTPPLTGGEEGVEKPGLWQVLRNRVRRLRRWRNGEVSPRDTLEELIEEREESEIPLDEGERALLANILELRARSAEDLMVPRADIVAIEADEPLAQVIELMTASGHSRLPVYRETLDDAIGMVHIKDVLAWRGDAATFHLSKILRRVLFVAPSMEVLELLLEMRVKRSHMALVVDEFGGVDGLVTIEDVVEEIVGEIEDEHDGASEPNVVRRADGSIDADARAPLSVLDEHFGALIAEDEREDIDTLGGLVVSLVGRVPIRGELIVHPAGLEFEIVDADPRRIKRVRLRRSEAPRAPARRRLANGNTDAR